ncbi:hypothetical protein [Dyadobacter sp. LHD-138]|uniref:hypothetical protein n=1 Tax=Dyadobacter sp. LHD-138 TaxID=3071413 RepID=UPI0027E0B87D|nr:hypothetical protein [Dyadobacter sp. LHD-138]MDQ6481343.1 hypothetical protein [Dyadobacter sp. LHD-138]
MDKSNIFVHIELSKLAENLTMHYPLSKKHLKSLAGYFNIIPPKYFSDALSPEWQIITEEIKQKGPRIDQDGKVVVSAVINTIDQMSEQECSNLVSRVINLREKVSKELE